MSIDPKLLDRINYLAKKKKVEGLTEDELVEQQKLRKEYLKVFKAGVRQTLDSIKIVD